MPKKVTRDQREAVLRLLAQGQDRDTIAAAVGVTPGQVSAVSAHVKMGTYSLPHPDESPEPVEQTAGEFWSRVEVQAPICPRTTPAFLVVVWKHASGWVP